MRILRFGELTATPWKNGGGATTQIASFPEGASLDDFEWRVSVADIAADGAFSRFDGVDRILTLATGVGLELTIDGRVVGLDAASAPFAFPGEADVFARLPSGPVRDVNVMTRRGVWSATVARSGQGATASSLLIALGESEVEVAGRLEKLAPFDAVFLDSGEWLALANALLVSFARC